jgi:hypothetical protein
MDREQQDIVRRQKALLEEMGRIARMRRGTVSKQEYSGRRERKAGQGACGPYYLWQGYVRGRRFGCRVDRQEAEMMQEEIECRKRFERLCEEYIGLGEALADRRRTQDVSEQAVKKGLQPKSNRPGRSRG